MQKIPTQPPTKECNPRHVYEEPFLLHLVESTGMNWAFVFIAIYCCRLSLSPLAVLTMEWNSMIAFLLKFLSNQPQKSCPSIIQISRLEAQFALESGINLQGRAVLQSYLHAGCPVVEFMAVLDSVV